MGASSRSPSPMTMVPSICTASMVLRIASTASSSALWRSPNPMVRAAAIAPFSTTRKNSRLSCSSMTACLRDGCDTRWLCGFLARQPRAARYAKPNYVWASIQDSGESGRVDRSSRRRAQLSKASKKPAELSCGPMNKFGERFCAVAAASFILAFAVLAQAEKAKGNKDWPVYGGGPENTQYSTLAQINKSNVNQLGVAWSFDTGEEGGVMQTSPIVVDGVLYGI